MRCFNFVLAFAAWTAVCSAQSTQGVENLLQRRAPGIAEKVSFSLLNSTAINETNSITEKPNDEYTIQNGPNGTINIAGNTQIALASGLRYYLNTYLKVDIYWFIGSQLHFEDQDLPPVENVHHGSSIVPWRYHFNTVTFSYTTAFWTWDDWELQLDWMALRGTNLPLAWVGYEKILIDVLIEFGFSEPDIANFLSGPAFQAWNRFGNIQGSWGGDLPIPWVNDQFELQKKIVARMVELGMTPVLPSFTGFVPRQIGEIYPNAAFVNGSKWSDFPLRYTNVTFLEPFDPLFAKMQKSFIQKQTEAYGSVSHIYTLDQYNENDPFSGDLDYLRNVTKNTIQALKTADPDAVWMLQGWLFFSSEDFWTDERVEAYLGSVEDEDMIVLDLFSETQPQWQRTNSYYGKPWIWCELHDYGENMGLYGQVENVTYNPIQALVNETSTMIGMGLTMEGQEGNEVIYDILLDQAWSSTPLDSELYFRQWIEVRYHGSSLPEGLYQAWDTMRTTIYNSTDPERSEAVTKSIFELLPNTTGLLNVTGHHATTITYDPAVLVQAWNDFYSATADDPLLWENEAYTFDLTDITRQVMANAFYPLYTQFILAANQSLDLYSESTARSTGEKMISLLNDLDAVLSASEYTHFNLAPWIASARAWASSSSLADFYEYNARNQITLWGPNGEINDYASKQWGGLIRTYYVPRWRLFVEFTLNSTTAVDGENKGLSEVLLEFEKGWQREIWSERQEGGYGEETAGGLRETIAEVVGKWDDVFGSKSKNSLQ